LDRPSVRRNSLSAETEEVLSVSVSVSVRELSVGSGQLSVEDAEG
jgi:hypothetical protein